MTIKDALAQATKQMSKNVNKALSEDVFQAVQETEIGAINDVVYKTNTSGFYNRRYEYEGMSDPENIVMEGGAAKNGTLVVVNETEPNPYLNGSNGERATVNKNLSYLIEYGIGQTGDTGYDYWNNPRPRPFTQETARRLMQSGAHITALKEGLRKQGVDIT